MKFAYAFSGIEPCQNKGFTLLELLVVLVVLGFVSAIMVVKARPPSSQMIQAESQRLLAALNTAQIESSRHGAPVRWILGNKQYHFEMQRTAIGFSTANSWRTMTEPNALQIHQLPQGISIFVEKAAPNNKSEHFTEVLFLPEEFGDSLQVVIELNDARVAMVRQWGVWQLALNSQDAS